MAHIRVTGNIGQETRTYLFCVFLLVEVVIGGGGGGGGGGDGGGCMCVCKPNDSPYYKSWLNERKHQQVTLKMKLTLV